MMKFVFYWLPRVLAICFILFISMFAMDVFGGGGTPVQIAFALFMHLLPSFGLLIVLILAWRWEWTGALVFGAAGILYLYFVWVRSMIMPPHPLEARMLASLVIAGPALLVALLFLVGWFKRHALRA